MNGSPSSSTSRGTLPIADGIDWRSIAAHTLGATPADLNGYLADAAAIAFRAGRSDIDDASIGQAVGRRGQVYPEREPEKLSEQDRRRFSVHEAGHVDHRGGALRRGRGAAGLDRPRGW